MILDAETILFGIIGIICVGILIYAWIIAPRRYKDYHKTWWKAKDKWK
ncbi:MAG: hypothetical protein Q4D99_00085 [Bacillota bacterium]|nr:hypothetical protein [Bacillota bacterium]